MRRCAVIAAKRVRYVAQRRTALSPGIRPRELLHPAVASGKFRWTSAARPTGVRPIPSCVPARTNDFQRLIHTIEQLTAVAGATVEESVLLEDLTTGARREVDVLVTPPGGPRAVRVGVECRDHARPADVTWIEQLRAKYDCLPVDRVVAVSRRGFTAEALAKGRVLKVETLSLDEAEAFDWARAVRLLKWAKFVQNQFVVTEAVLHLLPNPHLPNYGELWMREVAYADGTRRTVRSLGDWILAEPFSKDMQARAFGTLPDQTSAAPLTFSLDFPLVPGPAGPMPFAVLIDAAGVLFGVERFVITGECQRTVVTVPVEQATLGATALFHGQTRIGETTIRFAAAQHEGGTARLRTTLENGGTVLPLEVALVPPAPAPAVVPVPHSSVGPPSA